MHFVLTQLLRCCSQEQLQTHFFQSKQMLHPTYVVSVSFEYLVLMQCDLVTPS